MIREISEEIGTPLKSSKYLGAIKYIGNYQLMYHYFEVTIQGKPTIKEKDEHSKLEYVEIIDDENSL